MRIVAGIAKGMPLVVPAGSGVRPTSDRVREAIFSSLGDRVVGADVLDLFAGSGALGLEAASRGARSVVFVEQSRRALEAIRKNLANIRKNPGLQCEFEIVPGDVSAKLEMVSARARRFDLVCADPPYGSEAAALLGSATLNLLIGENGLLILESAKRDKLAVETPWRLVREADYGDTRVSFFAGR